MTSGLADEGSDYDLHAYTREAVPLEFRARLLKPRAARLELRNTFFEWSDEWIEPDGTVFDLMYRSCDLIEADVEARLGRGEGAVGYSTCLCHSVLQAQPVFDRQGWFRALQDRLKAATYPDRLVTGIIQRNLPLLGGNIHSYEHQIRSAFRRRDRRSTMVMADDENSDFVGNAAEQKVIREPPQIRLSVYHAPGLKRIVACLRPGSRNNEARCKTPLRALESQRARSSPLSRQCPNRPSDEGQATSASTAFDCWSSSSNDMFKGWIREFLDPVQVAHGAVQVVDAAINAALAKFHPLNRIAESSDIGSLMRSQCANSSGRWSGQL